MIINRKYNIIDQIKMLVCECYTFRVKMQELKYDSSSTCSGHMTWPLVKSYRVIRLTLTLSNITPEYVVIHPYCAPSDQFPWKQIWLIGNKNKYSRSNNCYLLQQLDACICFQAYAQLFEMLDVQITARQPVEQIIARQIATSCEHRTLSSDVNRCCYPSTITRKRQSFE